MTDVTRVPTITIAATPPSSPLLGDLWWSQVTGQQSIWYDDGNTIQWVISNYNRSSVPGPVGPQGPPGNPAVGSVVGGDGIVVVGGPDDTTISLGDTDPPGSALENLNGAYAVDTVAALKALTSRPPVVVTRGCLAADDGAGGAWSWRPDDMTLDNVGVYVRPTAGEVGVYKRIFSGPTFVRWFAAVLDGVTNDRLAFQAALDYGGEIVLDGNMVVGSATDPFGATMDVVKTRLNSPVRSRIITGAHTTAQITALIVTATDCAVEGINFECINTPKAWACLWLNAGGYRVEHCRFTGASYNPTTPSVQPGPHACVYVGAQNAPPYRSWINGMMSDLYIAGGMNSGVVQGAIRSRFTNITSFYPYSFGFSIGSGIASYDIQADNLVGIGCGLYGFSNAYLFGATATVEQVPYSGWQLSNMHMELCGWMCYFAGMDSTDVGSTKYGYDITDNGLNSFRFSGSARDCCAGGLEDKGGSSNSSIKLQTTSALVALGATTIPMDAVSGIYAGMMVSGTNIAPDTHVNTVVSTPAIQITINRPTLGSIAAGSTLTFSVDIQPPGHCNAVIDFSYVSHLDSGQEGIGVYQEDATAPVGENRNHHIKLHAVTEQAPYWHSGRQYRIWDVVSSNGLAWLCFGTVTGGTGNAGLIAPVLPAGYLTPLVTVGVVTSGVVLTVVNTVGVVDGMPISAQQGIALGTTIVSHTSNTVTLSAAVIRNGVPDGALLFVGPNGDPVLLDVAAPGAATGVSTIPVVSNAGAVSGMTAFVHMLDVYAGTGVATLIDGTTITVPASPDFTHISVSAPVQVATPGVSPALPAGRNILAVQIVSDGTLRWACMGPDTSGQALANEGIGGYAIKNLTLDLISIGNQRGISFNTSGGSDDKFISLKCTARIRDAYYGIFIGGTGSLTDSSFVGCDVNAIVPFYSNSAGVNDYDIQGGRFESVGNAYVLQFRLGTNNVHIDGGAYFYSPDGRCVGVMDDVNNVIVGAATFRGGSNGVPVVDFAGSAGTWSWGNAIMVKDGPSIGPGWRITVGHLNFTASAAVAAGLSVIPTTSTAGVANGMGVFGTNIPASATVVSFITNTSITISNPLTGAGLTNGQAFTVGGMITTGRVLRQDLTIAPTSATRGNIGEYMVLATPTAAVFGYYCTAADFNLNAYTWTPMGSEFGGTVRIVTAAGAVVMTESDEEVILNKAVAAATTVTLPPNPVLGQLARVSDGKGDAATNNISVQAAASGTINGGTGFLVMNVNWGTTLFRSMGGNIWSVL